MKLIILVVSFCVLFNTSDGKVFTKCQIAKELNNYKFIERSYVTNWVCLALSESGGDSAKVTRVPNQTSNYGIFQINSRIGCRDTYRGGLCNAKCSDFLDDNIADDIHCAHLIRKQEGFKLWKGWMTKCKQKPLPDIKSCAA